MKSPVLDERHAAQLVAALLARRPGYTPDWLPPDQGPDAALLWIAARYAEHILQRLNQAPEKNKLAFLDLLGIQLTPAQAARAPIVFQMAGQAADTRAPQGTRLAAPPPPDSPQQIVFETEQAAGLMAAQLVEVVSLWPGRDQYIDHSAAHAEGLPFQPWRKKYLENTPHTLYIAHDTLLALSGAASLDVELELVTPSSEHLSILWEYWDGQVWRGFKAVHPVCDEPGAQNLDSTNGLQRSGMVRLETDCAETSKTTVNDIEAFWIRGHLAEALPPLPGQVLPEIESIKLKTTISQPPVCRSTEQFSVTFDQVPPNKVFGAASGQASGDVIHTEDGIPVSIHALEGSTLGTVTIQSTFVSGEIGLAAEIEGAALKFDFSGLGGMVEAVTLDLEPEHEELEIVLGVNDRLSIYDTVTLEDVDEPAPGIELTYSSADGEFTLRGPVQSLLLGSPDTLSVDNITAQVRYAHGLVPDKAFADAEKLDLSKTFFPLGALPRPGSVFYFTSAELFSKPRAQVEVLLQAVPTPEQNLKVQSGSGTQTKHEPLAHKVVWEYWNGRVWQVITLLPVGSNSGRPDFTSSGLFRFDVPDDMALITVNDEEGLWMRVRLESGGYGVTARVTWSDGNDGTNEFTYVIPQPPALADFRLCYTWQHGPFFPEHVLTYNDFQYEDRTEAARWPGSPFQPYYPVRDITPALYLGFDRALPVDRLNLYFDLIEARGAAPGPALLWEYWNGFDWARLAVGDETAQLRVPGLVSFIGPADAQARCRFVGEQYWLRARLKEDGPPGEPALSGIYPNTIWASQWQTIQNEPIGTSTGRASQVFNFRQYPVLAGEHVELQELAAPRANVEWRILARALLGDDPQIIRDLEEMLADESQIEVVWGDLRLRRDRNHQVTEAWVRWYSRDHLFLSGPNDRHFLLDRTHGRLIFGDGEHGKLPPQDAPILARMYRTGGGKAGNLPVQAISQLLAGIAGVESVFNVRPAEGGADTETLPAFAERGPQTLRGRGRALSPADYETLAREATPAVAVARAIPGLDPAGRRRPGWLTLLIIPHSQEPRPWPSFGLREQIRRAIEADAPAGLAAAHRIHVTGPDYLPVDVEATLAPVEVTAAGEVEHAARLALERFFHPLYGGPEGRGWALGRDVYLSDLAAVLEDVAGLDYVIELMLLREGIMQPGRVAVGDDQIVVAGDIRLKLIEAES